MTDTPFEISMALLVCTAGGQSNCWKGFLYFNPKGCNLIQKERIWRLTITFELELYKETKAERRLFSLNKSYSQGRSLGPFLCYIFTDPVTLDMQKKS